MQKVCNKQFVCCTWWYQNQYIISFPFAIAVLEFWILQLFKNSLDTFSLFLRKSLDNFLSCNKHLVYSEFCMHTKIYILYQWIKHNKLWLISQRIFCKPIRKSDHFNEKQQSWPWSMRINVQLISFNYQHHNYRMLEVTSCIDY